MSNVSESVPVVASPVRIAVFVGTRGRGSNLRALHEASREGRLAGEVVLVIGSKADAPAIAYARDVGLHILALDFKNDDYTTRLLTHLRASDVTLIALAGYLRRLPTPVVEAFRHRIVNIHPALLPAWGGKGMYGHHVHEAVIAYGAKVSGCTAHLVDEEYDTGPILVQTAVPVLEADTPETLAARILPHEHAAFVQAVQLVATGRVKVEGRIAKILPADEEREMGAKIRPQESHPLPA